MPIIVIIIIIYYLLLDAYSLCTILHSRHFSWFALFWENLKTWDAIHEQRSTKVVYSIQEPLSLFTYLRKQLLKKNVLYRNVMTVAIENNSPFTCQFTERRSTCLGHNMMVVSKEFAYSRNTLDYAQFIKKNAANTKPSALLCSWLVKCCAMTFRWCIFCLLHIVQNVV